jgi:signal transduction histidine kinase
VRKVLAGWQRFRARAVAVDVALSVLLAVLLVLGSLGESRPSDPAHKIAAGQLVPAAPFFAYGLVLVACLVYIWRRRWPFSTLLLSAAAALIYTALGYVDGSIVVAPMIGIYNLATRAPARQAIAAAAVITAALTTFSSEFGAFGSLGGPTNVIPFEAAAALLLGLAVANRRAYVASVEDRAERAERSREEEARRRVDAERLRIARELHDVVAHNISMINVQARAAAAVIPDPPAAGVEALTAIKDASAEALRELRAILGLLRQADECEPTAPAPRLDQLDALVSATTRAGLLTTVVVTGQPFRLPATVDLAAYRIVQESLTNALRYAGPVAAVVSVDYRADGVLIDIDDDGAGVGPGSDSGSGHGIIGMMERASAIGGNVAAGPRPEGGFGVRAFLPAVPAS